MDQDDVNTDESIIVFGGQSYAADAISKLEMSVARDNEECDLQAEREMWIELEEMEENREPLTLIDQDKLNNMREKYDEKLFTTHKPNPKFIKTKRKVHMECYFQEKNMTHFKNKLIG